MNRLNQNVKVCAVIPFYNEKNFLFNVVSETLSFVDFIVAVNDGSSDGSEKTIANLDRVQVISLNRNYGKGYALQVGFNECIKNNYDIVFTLDADKQHDPAFIPDFIYQLNNFDIVIGNRLTDTSKMPVQRILSNKMTSFLLSVKTGQKIIDSQCGYRAYNINVLKLIKTFSVGYEAESEILISSAKRDFKIGFVKIPTIYGNEKSKMSSFSAIIGFIKVLLKY
ncbi:MAG: glycosyltransferase family 2 protein [Ignavibacterium sp.]|nr:glycosyltransferase family 2 protein [Ignavibacterium sp.]